MNGNWFLLAAVLWPMIGALLGYLVGRKNKKARDYTADLVAILETCLMAYLLYGAFTGTELSLYIPEICVRGLSFKLDGFRALYGTVAALMWMMTTIFSREYLTHYRNRNRYYLFTLMTCGATLGVFLAADLYTAFIFFEIMSFTSYVMVVHEEKPAAMRAAETYVAVAVIGGMVMLMGLFLLYRTLGTLDMEELYILASSMEDKTPLYLPGILILVGFGAKAGMYPLHIWLPKAHPVAPAPASALLSGILTKAGVFGILAISCNLFFHDIVWGELILLLGVITMFLGAVLAVFSIDLKRTLACSSMSQIGFILVGVGMQGLLGEENLLAVWGTLLHMLNHSLIKLDLFMCAGVVYMNLHKLNLNEIRGWGRKKPFLNVCFLMGVLGIIGMPFWNGYISKTLLHESIVEFTEHLEHLAVHGGSLHGASVLLALCGSYAVMAEVMKAVEWIFLISGGLTAAYMTKIYIAVFWEKPMGDFGHHTSEGEKEHSYMNKESRFAIGISALLLPVLGATPDYTMQKLAMLGASFMRGPEEGHGVHWFSLTNVKGAGISLGIGAAVYFLIIRTLLMKKDPETGRRIYVDKWPAKVDLENLIYRPLINTLLFITALVCRLLGGITEAVSGLLRKTLLKTIAVPEKNPEDYKHGSNMPLLRSFWFEKEVTATISFSLLMFGLGLCAALGYLIYVLVAY